MAGPANNQPNPFALPVNRTIETHRHLTSGEQWLAPRQPGVGGFFKFIGNRVAYAGNRFEHKVIDKGGNIEKQVNALTQDLNNWCGPMHTCVTNLVADHQGLVNSHQAVTQRVGEADQEIEKIQEDVEAVTDYCIDLRTEIKGDLKASEDRIGAIDQRLGPDGDISTRISDVGARLNQGGDIATRISDVGARLDQGGDIATRINDVGNNVAGVQARLAPNGDISNGIREVGEDVAGIHTALAPNGFIRRSLKTLTDDLQGNSNRVNNLSAKFGPNGEVTQRFNEVINTAETIQQRLNAGGDVANQIDDLNESYNALLRRLSLDGDVGQTLHLSQLAFIDTTERMDVLSTNIGALESKINRRLDKMDKRADKMDQRAAQQTRGINILELRADEHALKIKNAEAANKKEFAEYSKLIKAHHEKIKVLESQQKATAQKVKAQQAAIEDLKGTDAYLERRLDHVSALARGHERDIVDLENDQKVLDSQQKATTQKVKAQQSAIEDLKGTDAYLERRLDHVSAVARAHSRDIDDLENDQVAQRKELDAQGLKLSDHSEKLTKQRESVLSLSRGQLDLSGRVGGVESSTMSQALEIVRLSTIVEMLKKSNEQLQTRVQEKDRELSTMEGMVAQGAVQASLSSQRMERLWGSHISLHSRYAYALKLNSAAGIFAVNVMDLLNAERNILRDRGITSESSPTIERALVRARNLYGRVQLLMDQETAAAENHSMGAAVQIREAEEVVTPLTPPPAPNAAPGGQQAAIPAANAPRSLSPTAAQLAQQQTMVESLRLNIQQAETLLETPVPEISDAAPAEALAASAAAPVASAAPATPAAASGGLFSWMFGGSK